MPEWRSRTYTYSEPVDSDTDAYSDGPSGIDGTDNLFATTGNRADYDAGWTAGYRAGWLAGYEHTRKLAEHDLAVEGAGESPSLLL